MTIRSSGLQTRHGQCSYRKTADRQRWTALSCTGIIDLNALQNRDEAAPLSAWTITLTATATRGAEESGVLEAAVQWAIAEP
jgi:hypothetical protein